MPLKMLADFFNRAKSEEKLHLTSFDPCKHDLESIADKARCAVDAGTDGFLLGGSTGVDHRMIDDYAGAMRSALDSVKPPRPPLILFPSSASTGVSSRADGVLFLSLLNSRDVRFLIREQAKAAPYLKTTTLEPIGCGMIAVEPGGTMGGTGRAELIKHEDVRAAVGYAVAAEAFGFPLVYLNGGSGCDRPVPEEMIRAVAEAVGIPLIVGGGVTDPRRAAVAVAAGADVIVTGTAVESVDDIGPVVRGLADAVHSVNR